MAVPFLSGAIEGFYGQPWTRAERVALFDWLVAWGLNTYLYAPQDDLKHRALWRELYTDEESAALQRLIEACHARGLHFIFGLLHCPQAASLPAARAVAFGTIAIGIGGSMIGGRPLVALPITLVPIAGKTVRPSSTTLE